MKIRTFAYILFLLVTTGCSTADPTQNNDNNVNNANNDNNTSDGGNENNQNNQNNQNNENNGVQLNDPITVVTWNVERYFDTECDSGFCEDDDFESTFSEGEFRFQATRIADAIRDADPDIVLFQELEKEVCIEEIGTNLLMGSHAFGETFFDASLDVGVLTRGTVTETITHRDDTTLTLGGGRTAKFVREFLEVHIEIDGREVIVFNGHFKSKRNDDPAWRLAEAEAAAQIVAQVGEDNPDAMVILGGDLNDTPGSAPLEALEDELDLISSDETWTTSFGGDRQAIDHLLLYDSGNVAVDPDSVEAIRNPEGFGLSVSDHGALTATFGFIE